MTDVIPCPTVPGIEDGYGSWLRQGCEKCCAALKESNLLEKAGLVDWGAIRNGKRPQYRVFIQLFVACITILAFAFTANRHCFLY